MAWQEWVFYQVYPRSFRDGNGDGVGDLPGIVGRLDYLSETLGVDALWLSPFYPSPMADFGYDVADYRGVDPLFGNLGDFDRLLDAAHERACACSWTWFPTTPPTGIRGSWSRARASSPPAGLVRVARPRAFR